MFFPNRKEGNVVRGSFVVCSLHRLVPVFMKLVCLFCTKSQPIVEYEDTELMFKVLGVTETGMQHLQDHFSHQSNTMSILARLKHKG
ncbi:hypothetical protein CsSME_00047212 [Camellia sinensis var. sinensis]